MQSRNFCKSRSFDTSVRLSTDVYRTYTAYCTCTIIVLSRTWYKIKNSYMVSARQPAAGRRARAIHVDRRPCTGRGSGSGGNLAVVATCQLGSGASTQWRWMMMAVAVPLAR